MTFSPLAKRRIINSTLALLVVVGVTYAWWKFQYVRETVETFRRSDWMMYVLAGVITVAVLSLSLWVVWVIPKRQVRPIATAQPDGLTPKDLFNLENEARKTVAQIVGGVIVILGFFATAANIAITQRETEKNRALTLEGQITDRYTKAIDQLGNAKLEVRLGGIYALKRIAHDSTRDAQTIMDVLCSFVREKAPIPKVLPKAKKPEIIADKRPANDIQAALTVIGQLNVKGIFADLNNTDLDGANLSGAILEEANFAGATLNKAILRFAYLEGANIRKADLSGADLYKANLTAADIEDVDLRGAVLRGTNLTGAILAGVNLTGADLAGTDLQQTLLMNAKGLDWNQLESAIVDEQTKLPPEFDEQKKAKLAAQKKSGKGN